MPASEKGRATKPSTAGAASRMPFTILALSMSIMPVMDAIAKTLGQTLPVVEVAWARYVFQLTVMAPVAVWSLGSKAIGHAVSWQTLLQGGALVASKGLYFASLNWLPLGYAAMLFLLSPVYVVGLAPFVLGERPTLHRYAAVLLTAAGTLAAVSGPQGAGDIDLGVPLALAAGLAKAVYILMVRRTDPALPVLATATLTALVGTLLASVPLPLIWVSPRAAEWPLLFSLGGTGAGGQAGIIYAYGRGYASRLAPLAYIELPAAMALGFFVFHDVPDTRHVVGAVIVVSGIMLTAR